VQHEHEFRRPERQSPRRPHAPDRAGSRASERNRGRPRQPTERRAQHCPRNPPNATLRAQGDHTNHTELEAEHAEHSDPADRPRRVATYTPGGHLRTQWPPITGHSTHNRPLDAKVATRGGAPAGPAAVGGRRRQPVSCGNQTHTRSRAAGARPGLPERRPG
jgi:hypothetical protein